ncbi:MAG: endolytic transglycosylase MltG [Monoglobaceae bacterium]
MRKAFVICAAVAAAAVIFAVSVCADMFGIGGGREVDVNIPTGSSGAAIAERLKDSGIITFEAAFKLYAKIGAEPIYQAGIHRLNSGMSYHEIIAELESAAATDRCTVTIPEGYELRQIADLLEEKGLINREIFMREAASGEFDFDFVQALTDGENRLEGYLFPDTYTFETSESERDIINRMLDNFNNKAVPVYEQSGTDKPLSEIVTLASVIEREAAGDEDRGKVASVFVNRLNIGMKLESCATVQYILKERKPVLSNDDTRIDSPYNTYMYSGLPKGPISSPGLKSIEAALNPEQTNYLYFMASADGKTSVFAETYEEHLENMRNIQGTGDTNG